MVIAGRRSERRVKILLEVEQVKDFKFLTSTKMKNGYYTKVNKKTLWPLLKRKQHNFEIHGCRGIFHGR